MKNKMLLMILLSMSILVFNSKINAKQDDDDSSPKPKYEITVTQNGKSLGKIIIELYPDEAPVTCKNFDSLVSIGFYDGTAFHLVKSGSMIQGGDPNSKNKPRETWGLGDPSQKKIVAEFSEISHKRGILSMVRGKDLNSANSQFFIVIKENKSWNQQNTVFGHVLSGMDIVDAIAEVKCDDNNHPIDKVEMKIIKIK